MKNIQRARRDAAIIVAITMVLVSFSLLQAAQDPQIVHVDVTLPTLSKEADGFVIVQLSDIHIGAVVETQFLTRIAERVNQFGAGMSHMREARQSVLYAHTAI
jgi:uncharacterized protein